MAKRYVEECDLCKKEAELDNSLTLKPNKGKKAGRSYDLCDMCKETLEKALISRDGIQAFAKSVPVAESEAPRKSKPAVDDEHTLTLPDGTTRHIPSRQEIQEGVVDDPHTLKEEFFSSKRDITNSDASVCLHMNKSRPRISAESNKVYQECRDCGESLLYKSARQKAGELNAKPHAGVSLKTHASEERKRDD